jgi:hypothetical protein
MNQPREWGDFNRRRNPTAMDLFKTIAPYLRARFGNTERGAALVEYALLLALKERAFGSAPSLLWI